MRASAKKKRAQAEVDLAVVAAELHQAAREMTKAEPSEEAIARAFKVVAMARKRFRTESRARR